MAAVSKSTKLVVSSFRYIFLRSTDSIGGTICIERNEMRISTIKSTQSISSRNCVRMISCKKGTISFTNRYLIIFDYLFQKAAFCMSDVEFRV